jgi:hypothetical protein
MNFSRRIKILKTQHERLEATIGIEGKRPRPDSALIQQLKIAKLKLKDELARMLSSP